MHTGKSRYTKKRYNIQAAIKNSHVALCHPKQNVLDSDFWAPRLSGSSLKRDYSHQRMVGFALRLPFHPSGAWGGERASKFSYKFTYAFFCYMKRWCLIWQSNFRGCPYTVCIFTPFKGKVTWTHAISHHRTNAHQNQPIQMCPLSNWIRFALPHNAMRRFVQKTYTNSHHATHAGLGDQMES